MLLHSPLHSSKQLRKVWIGEGGREEEERDGLVEEEVRGGMKAWVRERCKNGEEGERKGKMHPLMVGVPYLGH